MIFNLKGLGSVHDGLVDLICDEGTLTLVPLSVQKYANVDGVIYCWAGFKLNKSQWVFRELELKHQNDTLYVEILQAINSQRRRRRLHRSKYRYTEPLELDGAVAGNVTYWFDGRPSVPVSQASPKYAVSVNYFGGHTSEKGFHFMGVILGVYRDFFVRQFFDQEVLYTHYDHTLHCQNVEYVDIYDRVTRGQLDISGWVGATIFNLKSQCPEYTPNIYIEEHVRYLRDGDLLFGDQHRRSNLYAKKGTGRDLEYNEETHTLTGSDMFTDTRQLNAMYLRMRFVFTFTEDKMAATVKEWLSCPT